MEGKKPELRVLHISTARTWRGGEQQIAYLVDELGKKGMPQWVVCVKGSKMEAWCSKSGVRFFPFEKIAAFNLLMGRRIWQVCQQTGATILHTHDSHGHTYAVLAAALFGNKVPIVVHRRVDFPVGTNWFSRWKYNHPAVACIICISHAILEIMKRGIKDPSKLRVINSGVDFGRFGLNEKGEKQPTAHEPEGYLRKSFNVPSDHFIIANVAAIAPHKDYFTFVKTAEILIREQFPARFFIIGGDGGEERVIRQLVKEKQLESHFNFLGHREDVPCLLKEVDVLLFTSKTEGMGGATFEAFASEVPVVATAAGGIPEVVEHEISGLLAPVGDFATLARYVRKVLEQPGLKAKLVQQANEKLRSFSKQKTAQGIYEVYQSVLEGLL